MKPSVYLSVFCALMLISCQKKEPSVTPASANQQPDSISGYYHGRSEIIRIDVNPSNPVHVVQDTTYSDTDAVHISKTGDIVVFNMSFLPSYVNPSSKKYVDSNYYNFSGAASHSYDNVDVYFYPPHDSVRVIYHSYDGWGGGSTERYYTFSGKK
ncbi:MAG: hypothetical protein JST70_11670 [Bacteroidetes bacterium]|nr:hypothetical protein [Bacteroidota bacterium]